MVYPYKFIVYLIRVDRISLGPICTVCLAGRRAP